jgi:hypothetical protein
MRFALVLTVLTFCISACKNQRSVSKSKEPAIKSLVTKEGERPRGVEQDFKINFWSITDSTITINITYEGGCNGYHFELVNNGMMMKSLPPKTVVYLEHDRLKEICNTNQTINLKFNISNLRRMNRNGSVMVKLDGQENYLEFKP